MAIHVSKAWQVLPILCCFSLPLAAHHSFGAEYDTSKPISLTGTITKIDWTNPHSFLFLDVKDDKGEVVNWKLEGYPPGVLYRTGWRKDITIKVGDTVTITGWRSRDSSNLAHSREVTLPDGRKLFFGPPAGTGDGGNAPPIEVK